jgi:hypothetical protein
VSLAAGITATILYFARSRDGGKSPSTSGNAATALRFGAAPLAHGGGAFVLDGPL